MKKGMTIMKKAAKIIVLAIIAAAALGLSAPALYGQADISGPSEIDKCDTETYTITVTNATPGAIGSIVVTNTLPNSDFSYVSNSAVLCLPSPGCAVCNLSGGSANPSGITVLTWDIDALCGGTIQLAQGESFTIQFTLSTNCDTISGNNEVRVDYVDIPSGTPLFDTDSVSIEVNPGAVIITKTPFVIPAGLNDTVTWTLTIENSGLGTIKNVVVTDVLGSGLQYVSDTESGVFNGIDTVTWTSSEFGALASMAPYPDPSYRATIDITAQVIDCHDLENDADVRWGCDGGPICFDTAVDGGTATAAVQFEPTNPFLVLTPPNISLNYCEAASTEVLSLFNDNTQATGAARNTIVKLQGLDTSIVSITNVQGGVTFNDTVTPPQFENIPDIAPGDTFNLTFDVSLIDNCNTTSGQILYIPEYQDECNNPFYPTPVLGTYDLGAGGAASLSVEKILTSPSGTIYIDETVSYEIRATYSGPTSCGSSTTGLVTVTDTIPTGFTIVDPGSGTPGPGTIQWTFDPAVSPNFSDNIILQSPSRDQCETYCNTTNINTVTATATDCCGCTLSASATASIVIECDQLNILTSSKTAVPVSAGPCQTLRITSEYTFEDNAALDNVDLEELTITENNNNRLTYAGLVSAAVSGTNLSGCIAAADNTPAGTLVFTFPTCGYGSVRNRTLTIVYDMLIDTNTGLPLPQRCQPVPPCGNSYSWEDWTDLDLGPNSPSGQCLTLPGVHETVTLTVEPPSMSVAITPSPLGAPGFVENCGTYDINITATQTSNVNPYDVRLVLENTNYYTIQILDCNTGDVQPVVCDSGSGYTTQKEWIFNDVFTANGTTGIIRLRVQKRCSNSPDLVARLYYDDLCHDDDIFDNNNCETSDTASSILLLEGDIFIEKRPEVVFTDTNQVQWTIDVTNAGDGVATNVTIEDTLQAAHTYVSSSVVPNPGDVTTTPGTPANGVTWTITSMDPGEVRTITLLTDFTACQPLGNSVSAYWGCDFDGDTTIDEQCEMDGPVVSTVEIPTPKLVSTSFTLSPISMCEPKKADITLRNAGQTNVYELAVSQTLPAGLTYGGNPEYQVNGGGWLPAPAPNPTTSPLLWSYTQDNGDPFYDYLLELPRGDILEIRFDIDSTCIFESGTLQVETEYKNPCGDTVSPNSVGTYTLDVRYPDVSVTKTRISPPEGDPIACGQQVQWQIVVENTGTYDSPVVWVEDTMDPGYTYVSSTGGSDGGFNGYGGNPLLTTWEITNLNVGQSTTLTLTADSLTAASADCEDVDNVVEAFTGCGGVDGDSSTKPGVDPPDNLICLDDTAQQDTHTGTRQPDLAYLSIAFSPGDIDACNDSTQLTIVVENTGPTDAYDFDLAITLPPGITYNAGTAEAGLGTDTASATAAIGAIGDPAISGSTITFYDFGDKGSNLAAVIQAAGGGNNDTLVLRFTVQSACYVTDDLDFEMRYYDCCDDTQWVTTDSQTLTALFPSLSVTKTADLSQVDCGSNVEYTIQITNNGTGNAEVILVVDTLGNWLDYAGNFTEDQPGTITPALIGGFPQVVGWEFNNLGPGVTATFTFEATLNPDGLPNQNDCTAALRQNNVTAQWGCGTSGDATDDDPNTTGYDCTDSGIATAGPVTLEMPNLVVTSITPDVSCSSDGTFSGTISVRVTNNGDGDTNGTFTVEVTDGLGWTGTGTYGLAIAAGNFADVTINTGTWTPDCQPCAAPYSFNATVDLNNDICECDESDNTTGSATTYTVPSPDLAVDSHGLSVVCADDNQVTVTGTVTLINNGCNTAVTSNIPMRFTLYDNTGCAGGVVEQWTDTFSSVNIASGGGTQAFTITNHTFTSNQCLDSTGCQVSIFVEADYNDSICECDGTNNTFCADNIPINIPDIEVDSDTLTVTCLDDGQVTVSGTVTLTNNGCGSNLNSNIPMRFTLYDNTGCAGSPLDQWTQTFAGVNIPSGGGTQAFAITPQTVTSDLVTNSTGCQVSIRVEADYNDSVCECDGTDNTYCADNKNINIPDLQISSDTLSITCLDDGQFTVSGTVTMLNNGCGSNLNSNIPVRFTLYDNTGCAGSQVAQWTETLAGVNIPALGGTQVFAITPQNITANLVTNSTGCQVSILMEADYNDTICESDGTDNSLCSNKTVSIPDLTVNSITPSVTCTSDGNLQGTVTVNVENIGCGDANNVVVRLQFDCGIPLIDQTINLSAGASQNVVFNYTPDCANCTCTYTATMDPANTICESNGTNNSLVSAPYTMDVPDLLVQSDTLAVNCSTDGQVTVSGNLTVQNDGCGVNLTTDIPVRFTMYDNTGCGGSMVSQWTETLSSVNIPSGGGTQVFAVTPQTIAADMVANSTGCQVSIQVELDHSNTICECDGTNNTYCADNKAIDIPDVEVSADTLSVTCFDDGQVTISGNVTLANNGCGSNLTSDVAMRFTLYDNTGCSGNQLLQWTQTFSSVNIPAGGGTQVFTVTPQALVSDLVTNSTNCQVSIRVEADYTNAICESDGTDNTYCADNIPVDIPDLEMQSETLTITYTDDGQVQVSGDLTLVNNGCGSNLTLNIPVRFTLFNNINCTGNPLAQWTETLSSVNMTAGGGTQVFTITPYNMAANLCTSATNCQVSIQVELDYTNVICESDGTDNTSCADKTIIAPDFTVNSVASTVICLNDGNLAGTTVNVSNIGCGDATGVTVRLVSDCGLTFADRTIDLAAGETRDVFFAFTAGITNCTCNFTGTIDPDNTIPECDGTNNTQTSTQGMLIPDLEIRSEALVINCVDDGVIRVTGTVTLVNNGCGPNFTGNIPMRFTLFDNTGSSGNMVDQWTQTFTGVNLPSAGGTQTFTIQLHDITTNFCTNSTNCMVSIRMEADYNGTICEWDGTDNTYSTDKTSDCLDLEAEAVIANTNCTEDGTMNGTVAVTVRSSGGNPITEDFSIRVDDGQGWTSELRYNADLGGTLPLAGGASSTVTFTWERDFTAEPFTCDFNNITALVDSQNEICQCDTQNDMVATTYSLPLPNLVPTAITPSCSSDGNYKIEVEIENNGCIGADAGSFTVHLEDNQGHSADILVSGLEHGETTTVDFMDWPASCEPNTVTFTVTVDYNNDVCEITGTDNNMEYVYTNTSPDLVITDVIPATIRTSPGTFEGTITVILMNNGNGAAVNDFKIICNDGEGWSTELFYQADLNGTMPIPPGGSTTVTVNWNRNFNGEPYTCDYNNITVGIDMGANVCECAADNNETVTSYHVPYPDLYVQSMRPYCSADGMRTLEVVIGNQGCEDQNEDFDVTFTDSSGQTRTVSFRSLGGRLPLKVGEKQKIILEEWEFDCAGATMVFTVTTDPRGTINDLQPANNTLDYTYNAEEPDLQIGDIQWTCNPDGSVSFTLTVVNEGVGNADNAQFIVYDESGNIVFSQRVDLPKGASKQLSFTTSALPKDERLTFRFAADEEESVCECNGMNNERSISIVCPSEEEGEPQLEIGMTCPPGQRPGGLFRFEIHLENTGDIDAEDVTIEDRLPDRFQYVGGSSVLNGQQISEPQPGPPLVWQIGTLAEGQGVTLTFTAVADADIDPGRYVNESRGTAANKGGTGILVTDWVNCYTVIPRMAGAGCCLKVEEWPMGGFRRPEGPLSFIEPYFHTETAMFTVYSIFNLWENAALEKGTMPLFMKERLDNYARSTIEEFYLASQLGLTLPDGTLWLSYAGAYPEKGNSWVRKQVDETMTVSQIGFELLALNKAVKVEEREEVKQKLKQIIDKKLAFLAEFMDNLQELPHGWEIKEQKEEDKEQIEKLAADATLYDKAVLYLAMVELNNSGYKNAGTFAQKLRELMEKSIDNTDFDRNNLSEEFIFMLALLEKGETEQAKAKIKKFEEAAGSIELNNLHDFALAAAVDYKAGGTLYKNLEKEMEEKYYLKDTGIFAEKQPDFTFKLSLNSLAPLILSFDTKDKEEQEHHATVLYRTFDEVGLFLKKRNLSVGKPLYSLLKNYPFTDPLLPVLTFTRANRNIAPVFSQDAVVHSTLVKPIGEILIPRTFSKILSPSYETNTSRIAAVSFALQYIGRTLKEKDERVIKEEGRSFDETGKTYIDSLLKSGAGIQWDGNTLLPFDHVAVKGPKKGEHNLEPLNAGTGAQISTETLANYLLAEKWYVEGKGKYTDTVQKIMVFQDRIVAQFKETGYIPEKFSILIENDTGKITIIPSKEKASKLTAAKLFHVLPVDKDHKFLASAFKKAKGELLPEDLIFLSAVPELVPYFKEEIQVIVDYKDSKVAHNAADIIGRRLLGDNEAKIEKSLENLKKHWDKEAMLPTSDLVENIEKGLIYHHEPQQLLLYLAATHEAMDFRFKRTLNFFTYLLENEWGVAWNSFITLPSAEYEVFREEPREHIEPGDLVNFRVRVDNTCPEGFGSAWDLASLFMRATFSPALIYTGTQWVEGLDVLGDFQWRYHGFPEGSQLEYFYQAFVPYEFQYNFIDGTISSRGRQGYQEFDPQSATGDDCEDIDQTKRMNFIPWEEIRGRVFEDVNVNGTREEGELGIPNILIKDTRGRLFRSDAEGRFIVLAGDEHEGIQLELKSLPPNYLVFGNPTRLVNRHYTGEISFALIPSKTVEGFVYVDENRNGVYDEGEPRPEGVVLEAKEKKVLTGKNGVFIFRNLPIQWQQWIKINEEQPYYKGDIDSLKFSL